MALDEAVVQAAVRIEKIFIPHGMRQRETAFQRQKADRAGDGPDEVRFAHYTTAEAALNIIRTKRIWMRNTTCMVDYREVQHGFDILKDYFDPVRTKQFADELDKSVPGAAMEAINRFDGWWRSNLSLNLFVACLSEHSSKEDMHGRLSMWRAFGSGSTRVAIVIKIPRYSEAAGALGLMFSPVSYLTREEFHAVIAEVLSNVSKEQQFLRSVDRAVVVNFIFMMLLSGVACLKHEGFREELEWRAIYAPQLWPSKFMETSIEVLNGVPQHVHKIPLDGSVVPELASLDIAHCFDRLIIGPSSYPWAIGNAFAEELGRVGVVDPHLKIVASGIPIRSAN
jgi:hypothetical protein